MDRLTEFLNSSSLDDELAMPSNDPIIYGIHGNCVNEVWPKISPLLAQALSYADGKYGMEDIKASVHSSDMQLWIALDRNGLCGVCVTEIVRFPRKKRLTILFFAGRRVKALLKAQPIFNWAEQMGCSQVELFGRPGWERFFTGTDYPFEKIHTVLRMKLKGA